MTLLKHYLGKRGRRLLVTVVGLLWALSLCFDVAHVGGGEQQVIGPGLFVLVGGWMGILMAEYDWVANPALIFLMLIIWDEEGYPKVSWMLMLAVSSIFFKNLFRDSWINGTAPTPYPIERFDAGFYLWMAALASGCVLGLISVLKPEWLGKPRSTSARETA